MTNNILFPILILIIASLTIAVVLFLYSKSKANQAKLNTLSNAKKKSEGFIEKSMENVSPILDSFYGEKSSHYLKNLKKQNQLFCNQIISLIMEYKPNIADKLTDALTILNEAYVNSFYEASQNLGTSNNPAPNIEPTVIVDEEIRQTVLMIAQLCHQDLDKGLLNDPYSTQKIILGFKDRIEAVFLENNAQADELSQYMDLIEQLRQEKTDMRQTINQLLKLLEAIYQKYQEQLKLIKNASFEKMEHEIFYSVFKLNEAKDTEEEKNN